MNRIDRMDSFMKEPSAEQLAAIATAIRKLVVGPSNTQDHYMLDTDIDYSDYYVI